MRNRTNNVLAYVLNIIVWSAGRRRWLAAIAVLGLMIGGGLHLVARTATQVAFAPTPPSNVASPASLATIQVAIEDAGGSLISSGSFGVELNIQGPNGFSETLDTTSTNGIASFTPVLSAAGSYTLSIAGNGNGLTGTSMTVNALSDGATFGQLQVGQTSAVVPVQIDFSATTTVGSLQVLTQGAPNLDFTQASGNGGTCASGTYTAGQSCTVNVVFARKSAGTRAGAVVLQDGSGQQVAIALLNGTGLGGVANFGTGASTTPLPGVQWTWGAVTDSVGNTYVAHYHEVLELPAGGGAPVSVATSVFTPSMLALDGAGRLYVYWTSYEQITLFRPGTTGVNVDASGTVFYGNPNAMAHPSAMAVDASGNIFLANYTASNIVEIPSVAGVPQTAQEQSFNGSAYGLAFDPSGNLFVSSISVGSVDEVPNENGALNFSDRHTVVSGLSDPEALAIDAGGNLYVGEDGIGVARIPFQNGAFAPSSTTTLLAGAVQTVTGLAFGPAGDLTVVDAAISHWQVLSLDLHDPQALSFTGVVGQTTTQQVENVFNAGNAPLNIQNIAPDPNFPLQGNSCQGGLAVLSGSFCTVAATFQPTAVGTTTGSIALTDDAVNESSTQTIPLTGTASANTPTVTVALNPPSPPNPIYGQSESVNIDVTSTTGGQHPGGTFSVAVDGGAVQTVPVSVTGPIGFGLGSLSVGSHTVNVTYNPDANSIYTTASGGTTFSVDQAVPQFQVNTPSPYTYGQQPNIIVTFQTSGGQVSPTGTITYQIDNQPGQTVNIGTNPASASLPLGLLLVVNNGNGSHSVAITYNGDGNFKSGLLTTTHVTVTPASSSLQFSTSGANVVFGNDSQVIVTVSGVNGGAVPTGGITYQLDANTQQSASLINGSATLDFGSQLGAASHSVSVNYAGDQTYNASSGGTSFTITKANQTITFTNLPASLPNNTPPITLSATGGGSGSPVTFTATGATTSGVNGSTLTLTSSTGSTITVFANQGGTGNYNAAPTAQATITVTQVATHVVLSNVAPFLYAGGQLSAATVALRDTFNHAVTSSGVPVQIAITGPNNFSQTFPGTTGVAGSATIDLSAATLTAAGTYSVTATSGTLTAASASVQVFPTSVTLPSEPVGTSAPSQLVNFFFTASTTVTNGLVVTNGVSQSLDFAKASSGSNCVGSHNANTSCVVAVVFTPKAVGLRTGAVVLYGSNNKPIQTIYLNGIGAGAAVAYSAVTATPVASVPTPTGIAVDASGNRYVASGTTVVKIAPNGSQSTVLSGLTAASGVAIDGAGNLGVVDGGAGTVTQVPNENGTLTAADAQTFSGLGSVSAIAVDGAGDVVFANASNGTVFESSPGGNGPSTIMNGLVSPVGVAFDPSGNLYVVDAGASIVYEVPVNNGALNGASKAPIWSCSGCNPISVATDAAGDVYIGTGSALVEVPSEGGIPNANHQITIDQIAGATNAFQGLAVDGAGNVFVSRGDLNGVNEYVRGTAPAIPSFGGVTIGQTSAPASELIQNIGNQPLTFSAINFNPSFPNQSSTCTTSGGISSGFTCTIATDFAPASAGPVNGSISISDNASNATSPQTISESGTGLNSQTITFTLASPVTYSGQSIALSATGGGSGNPVTFSIVSGGSFATLNGSTLTVTGVGSVTIEADQAGSATYAAAAPVRQTLVINAQTVTATVAAASKTYDGTASASITSCTLSVPDPSVTCAVASASFSDPNAGTGKTVTATGITLQGPHAADYALASTTATTTATINKANQAITFTNVPASLQNNSAPITLAATGGASGNPVTFTASGATTSGTNGSTLTLTSSTGSSITVFANQAGTGNYNAAPTAQATIAVTQVATHVSINGHSGPAQSPGFASVGTALGSVTVALLDTFNHTVASSGVPVQVVVTGPNNFSQSFGATTGANGTVSINLSSVMLASAGTYTITATSGTLALASITIQPFPTAVTFPSETVGTSAPAQLVSFFFTAQTTVGSGLVVTQGVSQTLDFSKAPTGSTCVGTHNAGTSCVVNVVFTPKAVGPRLGAVVLNDASGNELQEVFLTGTGLGAAIAFAPATQNVIGSGFSSPAGLAIDAAGSVYVTDTANNQVTKIASNGTTSSIGTGLLGPTAVAVSGDGTVAIADAGNSRIVLVAPNGVQSVQGVPGVHVVALTVDGLGNAYLLDDAGGQVIEVPTSGGNEPSPIITGLNKPQAIALDGAGNIYVADTGNNQVLKYAPGGGASTLTVATGITSPSGLAVDAAGDVYISSAASSTVTGILAGGGSTALGTGLNAPLGVAVDGVGNVYIADGGNSRVLKLDVVDAPAVAFPTTDVNATSAPQTVSVQNIGNQPLTFSSLTFDPNFPNQSSTCSTSSGLNPGSTCALTTAFAPATAGPLAGAISASDNAENMAGTQTIAETGAALNPQTIAFTLASPVTYAAQSISLQATGGGSDNSVTFSIVSGGSFATLNGNSLTITGAGSVTIQADQAGNATYAAATPVQQTLVITPATLTATLVGTIAKVYDGGTSVPLSASNFNLSAAAGSDVVALSSEPATGTFASASVGSNIAVSATGLTLTGGPAANYVLANNGTATGTGSITAAPVSATVNVVSKPYDGTTAATITSCTLSVTDPNVTCVVSGAAFSNPNVGTNKTVVGLALGGSNAGNYQLTTTSVQTTASINAIPATVTAFTGSKLYGSADPVLVTTETGFLPGDAGQIPMTTTRAPGELPGVYVTTPAASGAPLANYTVTYVNGTFTILQVATALQVTSATPVVYPNQPLGTVTVSVVDAFGAQVSSFSGQVSLTIAGPNSQASLTANAVSGLATFNASAISFPLAGSATLKASSAGLTSATQAFTIFPVSVSFPNTAVAPASPTVQTITIAFIADTTVASGVVTTQGALGLDYQPAPNQPAPACISQATQMFHAGDTCQVTVAFAPTAAGLRLGAVVLYDANGTPVRSVSLSGIGLGAVLVNEPYLAPTTNDQSAAQGAQVQNTIDNGADTGPFVVAVDGANNLYIAGTTLIRVVPSQGGMLNASAQIALTLPAPGAAPMGPFVGLAVRADGALFVSAANGLWMIPRLSNGQLDGSHAVQVSTVATGSLAFDVQGDLFAVNTSSHAINEMPAGASVFNVVSLGVQDPEGIALDSAGNLYVACAAGVVRFPLTPVGFDVNEAATLPSGSMFAPQRATAVAVDAAGDAYAYLPGSGVLVIPALNDYFPNVASSIVVDGMGNLYMAGTQVVQIPVSLSITSAPFPSTQIGRTSSLVYPLFLANVGNLPLTITPGSLAGSSVFPTVDLSDFSSEFSYCATTSTIAPSSTCEIGYGFKPQVIAPVSDTITAATNAVNIPGGAMTLVLSGSGIGTPQTINFTLTSPVTYAQQTITFSATGGGSSNPVTFCVVNGTTCTPLNNGSLQITSAATIVIEADQAGDATYAAATPVRRTLVVSPATLTATLVGTITKTYDGGLSVPLGVGNFQLNSAIGTDSVSLATEPATGTFASANVGSGIAVTATSLTLTGAQAANYVLANNGTASGTGSITPAMITAVLSAPQLKPYDGQLSLPMNTTCTMMLGGNTIADSNLLHCDLSEATFASPNAGTTAVVGVVLSGTNMNDYHLASVQSNVGITQGTQTVSFAPAPPSILPSTAPLIPLQATATSGLPITFSVTGPAVIQAGTTNVLQFGFGGGTVKITATQAGNSNVAAASAPATITVISTTPLSFGPVPIGQSTTQLIPFIFSTQTTLGSAPSVLVVTEGQTGLDYNASAVPSGFNTCTAGVTYGVNGQCYVSVTFSPITAGQRLGAVILLDNNGNAVQTVYMTGVGTAPQERFSNPAVARLLTANSSACVTVDAGNNAFMCQDKQVVVYPAGPASAPITILSSGPTTPAGIAIDGAGNLMINDGHLFEIPAAHLRNIIAGSESPITINPNGSVTGNGFYLTYKVQSGVICGGSIQQVSAIGDMKFDAVGNLFYGPGPLMELANNNGVLDTSKVVLTGSCSAPTSAPPAIPVNSASGRSAFSNLAFDSQGNLYLSQASEDEVDEVLAVNGVLPISNGPLQAFPVIGDNAPRLAAAAEPMSLTFDPAGDMYLGISIGGGNGYLLRIPLQGSTYNVSAATQLMSGLWQPKTGVALDNLGNVYLADTGSNHVAVYTVALGAPTAVAVVGAPANGVVGPQTTTVLNTGNFPLTLSGIQSPSNFPASFGCQSAVTANPGFSCTVSVSYQPGDSTGVNLASLALIAQYVDGPNPQVFPLEGASGAVVLTPNPVSFANALDNGGASAPVVVTLSNGTTGVVTVGAATITGTNASNFSIVSNACPTTLVAGAACTLQVAVSPTAAGAISATLKIAGTTATLLANGSLWTPSVINFHNVQWNATSLAKTVKVFNPLTTAKPITNITITGVGAAAYSETDNCGSVAAKGSCTISITFKPTYNTATNPVPPMPTAFSAYLSFTTPDGVTQTSVVELSGAGVPANVSTYNTTPDAFQTINAGTFVGSGVRGVTVSFDGVSADGTTTATSVPTSSLPSNFQVSNPSADPSSAQYFDVTTSATGSGPYTVCFAVPAGTTGLDVYHYEMTYDSSLNNGNGGWATEYVMKPLLPESTATSLCVQTATLSPFAVVKRVSIGTFAAFSTDFTWLRANATVTSGNIGANVSRAMTGHTHVDDGDSDDLTVLVGIGATMPTGSLVAGDTVNLKAQSSVYNVADNFSVFNKKSTVGGKVVTPFALPFFAAMPAFPVVTPGSTDVYVPKNQTMTLAAGSYGNLHVDNGGTLILSGGLYQFISIAVDQNATMRFHAASEVRVQTEFGTLSNSNIIVDSTVPGLRASQIVFYVQGVDANCSEPVLDDDGDDAGPVSVHVGSNSVVQANIYAANGTVWLKSKTQATGAFIGIHVRIGINATLTLDSAFK